MSKRYEYEDNFWKVTLRIEPSERPAEILIATRYHGVWSQVDVPIETAREIAAHLNRLADRAKPA